MAVWRAKCSAEQVVVQPPMKSPATFQIWVFENDLDGRGYELWLITTKVKDSRDITFERPALKFDVFDNQPFPKEEEILDELPKLKL